MNPALSPEQWDRAWELFQVAAELPASERRSYLTSRSNDTVVVEQVLVLLKDSDVDGTSRSGAHVSHYRIGERIGQGGMGEVYEAVDLELDRSVAIKFLPEDVLGDERAVRRFLVEAKSASALNHPNLVTIHEFLRQDRILAIVMERIDGDTLRSAIPQPGQWRVATPEWLRQARQLAEALAAAHQHGIIHRDLKPENIMVRSDGYVKILDFGLAMLTDRVAPGARSETALTTPAGTPRYMSPEQKREESLSAASDIYSLGLVYVEMLSGKADTSVLAELPRRVPREIAKLIPAMLSTAPEERPSAAEVARALAPQGRKLPRRALVTAAGVVLLAGLFVLLRSSRQPVPAQPNDLVVQPLTSFPGEEFGASFSPDGERIVFAWDGERQDNLDLYVMTIRDRKLRRLTSSPAPDTHPAWSPDGKTIAFSRVAGSDRVDVFLIPAEGGRETAISQTKGSERVLDWSPDSQWVVVQDALSLDPAPLGLYLVSVTTGERRVLVPSANGEHYMAPVFSPDGRRIAFVRDLQGIREMAILALSRDYRPTSPPVPVRIAGFRAETCSNPRWTRDGRGLVFTFNRGGPERLWRIPLPAREADVVTPRLLAVGEGVELPALSPLGDRLVFTRRTDDSNIWKVPLAHGASRGVDAPSRFIASTRMERYADIARDGRVAFESDRSGFPEIWVSDASGKNAQAITAFGGPVTGSPRWSPDGTSIAFDARVDGQPEIYVVKVGASAVGSAPQRLTHHPGQDFLPAWSPDGRWIYFNSNRAGPIQVWRIPSGGGEAEQITRSVGRGPVVSPDGQWLYYNRDGQIWRVPSSGGPETSVAKDALPRSYVPVRDRILFLRWHRGHSTLLLERNLLTGMERTVGKLTDRVQTGLAVARDESFALITRTDEGTRDLMLVERFASR